MWASDLIEPYPADNRHAASHTEAVPTFSRTFSEGADTGTASSSSALWKATGTCHAWPNPRIAGSSSFTVQVAMPAMFSALEPDPDAKMAIFFIFRFLCDS